ncbi:MAG: AsmA family protein [Thiohalomonadaceae bacterium]
MKKAIKIISWLLAGMVTLLVAAVIIVPLVFDPNNYRDEISALVKKHTGRELVIEGKIELSLFPWLGMRLGAMQLSNAEGFGPEPFARIETADVRIKLLPLLHKEVEMEKIVLHGLEAYLGIHADGRSNWDDLVAKATTDDAPTEKTKKPDTDKQKFSNPALALAALSFGGLELRESKLIWDDQQARTRYTVEQLNLAIGAVQFNEPFAIKLDFNVDSSEQQARGHIQLNSHITLNLREQKYHLDTTVLAIDLQSALIPGGQAKARLAADIQADLQAQTAQLANLQLDAQGLSLQGQINAHKILASPDASGHLQLSITDANKLLAPFQQDLPTGLKPASLQDASLKTDFALSLGQQTIKLDKLELKALGLALSAYVQGQKIIDAPQLSGQFKIADFVPRDLLHTLAIELPEMADPSTLTKASGQFDFTVNQQQAAISNLQLQFDDSSLNGSASVKNYQQPALRYDITLNTIDADRYLPPPEEKPDAPVPPVTAAAAGATQLPPDTIAQLRQLDIDGTARIGKLKAMNLRASDVHATLKAKDGLLRVYPVEAKLYDGSYDGNLSLDVRGKEPLIGMHEKLTAVQSGPLLKDFMGKDYVTGTANLSAQLTAQGLHPEQVRRTLNGQAAFSFTDGAVNGINVAQLIRNAYAAYQKQPLVKDEVKSTDFALISGSATIKNGLLNNQDLKADSPLLRVEGQGTVHLATEDINYLLKAAIVGTLKGQGGKELDELKGLTVPLRITGSFSEPKFNIDLASLLDDKAKQKLDAEKQKVLEKLDSKRSRLLEKLDAEKHRMQRKLDDEEQKQQQDPKTN